MFVITEAVAAAIRAIYEQWGEFAAAIELRRRFAQRAGRQGGVRAASAAETAVEDLKVARVPSAPTILRHKQDCWNSTIAALPREIEW
jgi:hypothetical protein